MLRAILDGKGRTIPEGLTDGDSLRKVFRVSEDLLTATVFERLAYLNGITLWSILQEAFRPNILPKCTVVKLDDIEFWPRWSKANAALMKDVEPDVVMRFSIGDSTKSATIIVESKLGTSQYPDQWRNEWIAHEMEFAGDEGPNDCFFLALGGLGSFKGRPQDMVSAFTERASVGAISVVKAAAADWSDLLRVLYVVEVAEGPERRIVEDVRQALALHGYRRVRPLGDLAVCKSDRDDVFEKAATVLRPLTQRGTRSENVAVNNSLEGWAKRTAAFRPVLSDLSRLSFGEPMPTSDEMKTALADVRRAYRLVWSYQRRILDIVALIAGEFEEHEFYVWETFPRERPSGRSKDPTGRWAWDLLPLHQPSFLYLSPEADRNKPVAGQWMLEIMVDTDDGFYDPETGDEPDAADFKNAATTASKLLLYGWLCTASCERNWLNGVWHRGDWPEKDDEVVEHATPPFKIVRRSFDLAGLVSEDTVKEAARSFKATLGTTLGIGAE